MVHGRPTLPQGHGEVLMDPPFAAWAGMLERNLAASATWVFEIDGETASTFRIRARNDALQCAREFSSRLGVKVVAPGEMDESRIVLTGHQPDLYHPGVWVKGFAVQRLANETGVLAVDIVVDTDGFDTVALSAPCLSPSVLRCTSSLAFGADDGCYACTPVPSAAEIDAFVAEGDAMLATLPAPAIKRHFDAFAAALRSAEEDAQNLAELITFARRRYEARAGTTYLELPLTALASTGAFHSFALDIARRAREFALIYNDELGSYRALNGTRSKAQPFPDLAVSESEVELPFWIIAGGSRQTAWLRWDDDGVSIASGDTTISRLDSEDDLPDGVRLAPKALTLTLYARMFVSDLFIHGVGGGRYDSVTDGVARRFYGVEPPEFAVASMTMHLPLGGHAPSDDEIAEARRRLNRLDHNPDSMLGEVDFDSPQEKGRATSLAAEKESLIGQIAQPDADKKSLGARIRNINSELSSLLDPFAEQLRRELESLEDQRASADVLTDRSYPFCLWSPEEIADKII